MVHSGKIPVRSIEKVSEYQREADIRKVSERIGSIEKNCNAEGFDTGVVEDIGGILTLGVCSRSGINLDVERLGVSLLDEDRRSVELDMANRIRSKSSYLERAAQEVLGPFIEHPEKNDAMAYWTTLSKRLDSKKVGAVERNWLMDENVRQDAVLMRDTGDVFKAAMAERQRKNALTVFSRIRRAGNRIPVFGRLFKFG